MKSAENQHNMLNNGLFPRKSKKGIKSAEKISVCAESEKRTIAECQCLLNRVVRWIVHKRWIALTAFKQQINGEKQNYVLNRSVLNAVIDALSTDPTWLLKFTTADRCFKASCWFRNGAKIPVAVLPSSPRSHQACRLPMCLMLQPQHDVPINIISSKFKLGPNICTRMQTSCAWHVVNKSCQILWLAGNSLWLALRRRFNYPPNSIKISSHHITALSHTHRLYPKPHFG